MSEPDNCKLQQNPPTAEDVKDAIEKLQGNDRVGSTGQCLTTGIGAAVGVTAGGAVAGAVGATTLLGSTTLAGALGTVFVVTTPIGWVVGGAVVGAAAAYGVSRMVRSGGRNDRLRREIAERLSKRLKSLRSGNDRPEPIGDLRQALDEAIQAGQLSSDQATRMVVLVDSGKLDIDIALSRVRGLSKISS